ncbi:MAG TPA: anti-sigma factor, partial [Thermomicrobiales bacterium]|nr:anti-sigma factor [Thermomicrobiales bacterium]
MGSSPTPRPRPRPRTLPRRNTATYGGLWPVATGVAIAALLGMLVWNINLRGDVDDLEEQLSSLVRDNAALRENANATVYQLTPTSDAPDNAHAQAWFSVQGSGVLSVANLPVLSEGRSYQLWYSTDSPTTPIPGGTFRVDDTGQG